MHKVQQAPTERRRAPLRSSLVPISSLSTADRGEMLALMQRHYDYVTAEQFATDLKAKQWVVLARDDQNKVCGFATQELRTHEIDRRLIRVLFSGDTIVDRRYWGNNSLIGAWGDFAIQLMDKYGGDPLYWHLITKGYKTYRLLPLFFHEFYPRYDQSTPPSIRKLIDSVSLARFPKQYDSTVGVVRATSDGCRLRSGIADITSTRLRNPHIRYFADRNPGHAWGDELSCLAPLSHENFTETAYRAIHHYRTSAAQ